VDKAVYLFNESVHVVADAGNGSFDLWIRESSGWFLALQNYSGGVEYVYNPSVGGDYTARLECFAGGKNKTASVDFSITGGSFVVDAFVPVQGPAVVGFPVSWTQGFRVFNPSDKKSSEQVCLGVPADARNISVYVDGVLSFNSSCFYPGLKRGEAVNVTVFFQTAL